LHQPLGRIGSSTSLQLDGGWKFAQFAQLWSFFGDVWYATSDCFVFAIAFRTSIVKTGADSTTAAPRSIARREISIDPNVIPSLMSSSTPHALSRQRRS
jgi:hypothetical protein